MGPGRYEERRSVGHDDACSCPQALVSRLLLPIFLYWGNSYEATDFNFPDKNIYIF